MVHYHDGPDSEQRTLREHHHGKHGHGEHTYAGQDRSEQQH
jgi:hypothetical protein